MSTQELFVAAARNCLCANRKRLSVPQCVDLATQILAVDLGLKPALLYDINSACAEQVQQYLSSLQAFQLVSKSLFTLDLNGNALIVNPVAVISNLEQVLNGSSIAVIDICHTLDRPSIINPLTKELNSMIHNLLLLLREAGQLGDAEKPFYVKEKCEQWNLSTAFGLLLGYPITYWFDQTQSFENCLSMTPLMVTTASVTWQADAAAPLCQLYSFSVPDALLEETRPKLEHWELCLQERFQQQNVLQDLKVCQTTVTVPSVCL